MLNAFRDERGVALVMALIALVILSALVVGFAVLSSTEPSIAGNQLRVAQARALAESGVERALWALSTGQANPTSPGALANPLPSPVPAPYDGSQLVTVSAGGVQAGGFRVTVSPGAEPNQRNVVAVGWVPTDSGTDTRTKAHQKITATLMNFKFSPLNMPCALCVRGEIQVGGNSTIDSRADTSCGNKYGTWSTRVVDSDGDVISPGTTVIGSGAARIYGADGNNTANQASDMAQAQPQSVFDSNALTNADINVLKAYAKAHGTYYQGSPEFNSSNPLPNGLVFVDTVSGNNITPSTRTEDYASPSIHGNAGSGPGGVFTGWLIVNGSLSISGNFTMHGMAYVINDISYTGTGTGGIYGQLISANIKDTIATVVDTGCDGCTGGNSQIIYNCAYATTGDNTIPQNWAVLPGSYKEVSD